MNNNKQKHIRLPNNEFNSIMENEHSENDSNLKNQVVNAEITENPEKSKDEKNFKKSRIVTYILFAFIVVVIICFSIIFPLVYNKKTDSNNNPENSNVQQLIDANTDSKYIFETNDYYVLDKITRKNKVFTQGLFFDTDSTLIESGGLYGKSKLRRFNISNPDINLWEIDIDKKYFAEGACIYLEKYILQLTWKERVILLYEYDTTDKISPKINFLRNLELPREIKEGWGISNDNKYLIVSDGTSNIYYLLPDENLTNLTVVRTIEVKKFENDMTTTTIYQFLNELEFVKNRIFSNVWLTNFILVISPEDGSVMKLLDFSKIVQYEKELSPSDNNIDVLNGIAFDFSTRNFFITGKLWNHIYIIKFKFDI